MSQRLKIQKQRYLTGLFKQVNLISRAPKCSSMYFCHRNVG